jgi:hypothetical protein
VEKTCNCEQKECEGRRIHGAGACPNQADPTKRVMYVGALCSDCYERMPRQYRLPPSAGHVAGG